MAENDSIVQAMTRFVQRRLAALLKTPDGWGPPHAVELQLLLLVEMEHVVSGVSADTVDEVTLRYDRYLGRVRPGPPRPLALRLDLDERSTPEFVSLLTEFLRLERGIRDRKAPLAPCFSRGETDVLQERAKQIEKWGHDHDDGHLDGALAAVAAVLAYPTPCSCPETGCPHGDLTEDLTRIHAPDWALPLRQKHSRREQLVIAAALCIAEIDRMDRMTEIGEEKKQP